jgi:hypothetical protein
MEPRRSGRNFPPRSPLRSFALGGLLGAAGAVATVRRLRRSSLSGEATGLAAFEDAPCFLEHARAELEAGRETAGGALEHGSDPP